MMYIVTWYIYWRLKKDTGLFFPEKLDTCHHDMYLVSPGKREKKVLFFRLQCTFSDKCDINISVLFTTCNRIRRVVKHNKRETTKN